MRSWRTGLSLGVIAALVIAIWAAVSAGGDETDPPATSTTRETTTTGARSPTTEENSSTTSEPSTTVTTEPTSTTVDSEARNEEVRLILQDLYYRWFDAIYRNDEDAVRQVIATGVYLNAFRDSVENMELPRAPQYDDIVIRDLELLRDTRRCLVTFATIDLTSWRGQDALTSGVNVLLPVNGGWRFATSWTNKSDLWEADCDIQPELP